MMRELMQQVMQDYGQYMAPQQSGMSNLVRKYSGGGLEGEGEPIAPNYAPVQGAVMDGGGYAPPPQVAAVAPRQIVANPALNAMFNNYFGKSEYSDDLAAVRQKRAEAESSFAKALEQMSGAPANAPSQSEMYFKLASAFANPGKTGSFMEGLGQASGVMAEHQGAVRSAKDLQNKTAREIAMERQKYALENIRDEEKTLLALRAEEGKDQREMIKTAMKEYIDSGKPLSEAGKIAKDMGLKPGTPEYEAEVDKQANIMIEKQMGAIRAQMLSGQATLAGIALAQQKEARAAVELDPDERKAVRDDEDAVYAAGQVIENLDEAIALSDSAFTGTAADRATYRKLKQTNPTDPRVIATEKLENLIGQNVMGSLKSTVGGNPTEGERRALADLGGLGAASKESRRRILESAKGNLSEAREYRNLRMEKILSGGYKKKAKE